MKIMNREWQDLWLTIGGLAFTVALIPTLLDLNTFIPWKSSYLTAFFLTGNVIVFYSRKWYWGSATQAMTAGIWWSLLFFRSGLTW